MQEERIGKYKGLSFILLALFIDLLEMFLEWLGVGIAGLSTLISICTACLFWILFKIHDVQFFDNPTKFYIFAGGSTLELIPGADAIGGFFWTFTIYKIVDMVRKEDGAGDIIPFMSTVVNRRTPSLRVSNLIKSKK